PDWPPGPGENRWADSQWVARIRPFFRRTEPLGLNAAPASGAFGLGPEQFRQLIRGGDNRFMEDLSRLAGQALDRAGHRQCGNDPAGLATDRRRYRSNPGLTFAQRLRPAAPAYSGQNCRRESGMMQAVDHPLVVFPSQKDLCSGTSFHG